MKGSFTGLLADPVRQAALKRHLPAVGTAPNPRNTYDLQELIKISRDQSRNPIPHMRKDFQSQTNTCASHAGSNVGESKLGAASSFQKIPQLSRSFLYLFARWEFAGNMQDLGTSIQSIVDRMRLGIPEEHLFPWPTWATDIRHLESMMTPEILASAEQHKFTEWTEATDDFDLAVSRVLLGDPILWGTGWGFPSGQSGHATAALWARWHEQLKDFVLDVFNSHPNQPTFICTRQQYRTVIRERRYGAYHIQGRVNLRFDPKTQPLL